VLRYSLVGGLWRQVAETLVQRESAEAAGASRARRELVHV